MNSPRTRQPLRRHLVALAAAALACASAQAAVTPSTPANAFGNFENIAYGAAGNVFELQPYLFVNGLGPAGTASGVIGGNADLSFTFSSVNKTAHLFTIDYTITYKGASPLNDLRFMVFANPDGNPDPLFTDVVSESWGPASATGPISRQVVALPAAPGSNLPSLFLSNQGLVNGPIDPACTVVAGCDATFGLQWNAAQLKSGEQFVVQVGLSDDGTTLSSRFLTATAAGAVGTALTFSGTGTISAVPEPASWAILLTGLSSIGLMLRRRAGAR